MIDSTNGNEAVNSLFCKLFCQDEDALNEAICGNCVRFPLKFGKRNQFSSFKKWLVNPGNDKSEPVIIDGNSFELISANDEY